ncbi:hypothetical protein ES703_92126 [subsurface metagenome]
MGLIMRQGFSRRMRLGILSKRCLRGMWRRFFAASRIRIVISESGAWTKTPVGFCSLAFSMTLLAESRMNFRSSFPKSEMSCSWSFPLKVLRAGSTSNTLSRSPWYIAFWKTLTSWSRGTPCSSVLSRNFPRPASLREAFMSL